MSIHKKSKGQIELIRQSKEIDKLKGEVTKYRSLFGEAMLVRDKEFMSLWKDRSDLLKLTEDLKEAINYHIGRAKAYEMKNKDKRK